jgi:hypothetical protein
MMPAGAADRELDGRDLVRQDAGRLLLLGELGLLGRASSEQSLGLACGLLELGLLSQGVRRVGLFFTPADELALTPPSGPGWFVTGQCCVGQ